MQRTMDVKSGHQIPEEELQGGCESLNLSAGSSARTARAYNCRTALQPPAIYFNEWGVCVCMNVYMYVCICVSVCVCLFHYCFASGDQ